MASCRPQVSQIRVMVEEPESQDIATTFYPSQSFTTDEVDSADRTSTDDAKSGGEDGEYLVALGTAFDSYINI